MTPPDTETARADLLAGLAGEIPRDPSRFTLVGVDGVDGSGKSTFAQGLAEELAGLGASVAVIHMDDFHNVRAARYRLGRESPEGFWLDSYDYEALHREVLDPLGPDGHGRYRPASSDLKSDSPARVDPQQAHPGSIVIVEGMFLHRDELAVRWDYSLFLDVPFSETARRMAARDGSPADPEHPAMARYVQGQRLYFQACKPWSRATRIIDNSDWGNPRVTSQVATSSTTER
ncbi:MAG: AAA family ATPase [Specibacter sp.]